MSASHYSFVGVVEEYGEDALHNARDLDDAHHPAGIWDGADFEGYRYMINFCNPARTVPDICVTRVRANARACWHGAGYCPHVCMQVVETEPTHTHISIDTHALCDRHRGIL